MRTGATIERRYSVAAHAAAPTFDPNITRPVWILRSNEPGVHVESFMYSSVTLRTYKWGMKLKLDAIRRDVFRSQRLTDTSRVTLADGAGEFSNYFWPGGFGVRSNRGRGRPGSPW